MSVMRLWRWGQDDQKFKANLKTLNLKQENFLPNSQKSIVSRSGGDSHLQSLNPGGQVGKTAMSLSQP